MSSETLLHRVQGSGVGFHLHTEQVRHHVHRAIILGRSQAPGHHNHSRTTRQLFQGPPHGLRLIRHHPLLSHVQPRIEQSIGEESRIGVGDLAAEDFISYGH